MVGHRKGHRQSGLVVGRFTGWWDIGRAIDSGLVVGRFTGWWDIGRAIDRVDWWSVGLLGGGT